MLFDADDTPGEKLKKASDSYLRQLSLHVQRRKEMQRAFAFRHGQQWDEDAKRTLENEGRPCLTFNLIAPVMRELIGANQDQRRQAKAAPVGHEDLPTAETVNHLWQREFESLDVPDTEDQVFDHMITAGVGFAFIDAQPDYEDPSSIALSFEHVPSTEVLYDQQARGTNLKDCKEFYWHRWVPESEFKKKYPEFADQFEALSEGKGDQAALFDERSESLMYGRTPSDIYRDSRFYDDKGKRVRVIRCMYEVPVKKYFAWDPRPRPDDPSTPIGMGEVNRVTYQALKQTGVTQTYSVTSCEWRWFEFTGLQVLFDDKQPLDLGGMCQLLAATCYYDDAKAYHYGMVRDLQDPQSEFNKRYSQELNHLNKQVQPGATVTAGGLGSDPAAAERKLRNGGLIELTAGAQFVPLPPPVIPAGAETLAERARGLVSIISGVDTNPMLGGQPEQVAVGTALLSHRKGLMSISTILTNFRAFQRAVLWAGVRTILSVYPDEQIERMLGDSEKLRVQGGVVIDTESGAQLPLRDLRAMKWNVEQDSAAANTTQQLLELNMLQSLAATGLAIDPEVIFEHVPVSREQRQKLIAYYRASSQAAAQAQAQQQATAQQQVDQVLQIETGKVVQRQSEAQLRSETDLTKAKMAMATEIMQLVVEAIQAQQENAQARVDAAADQGMRVADHQVDVARAAADITSARRAEARAAQQPKKQAAA